jgi:hypothetical protein
VVVKTKRVGDPSTAFLEAFLLNVETLLLQFIVEVELIDAAEISILLVSDSFYHFFLRPSLKINS